MPPSKESQAAEAKARLEAGVNPGETADALDVVADSDAGDTGAPPRAAAPPAETDAPRPAPPVKSRFDDKRNAIVGRFREDRTAQAEAQTDDISEFTRSGMPPEFAEPNAPVIPAVDEPPAPALDADAVDGAAPPASPKHKLKVRGQEVELPLETILAEAQKSLAGESYLDEGRNKLNEIDRLYTEARTRLAAPHAGQDGQHPARPNSAQPTEPVTTDGQDSQHPEDRLAKLVEAFQFGDPADAGKLLDDTISQSASKAVDEQLRRQRLASEAARTSAVLNDFKVKHADVAGDRRAVAAIESITLDLQLEDIKALGIDPATLPTATPGVLTPADIAVAHKWYRAEGYDVRKTDEMLETAMSQFLDWRGIKKPTNETVEPAPNNPQPNVALTVDRAARRQTIPQQPGRTAAPRQAQAPQPPAQPRDRSDIVRAEIARRNAPRGRITA